MIRAGGVQDDDQARSAWRRLRTLVHNNDQRRKVSAAVGMSFIRAKALRELRDGPLSMRELADRLATDRPYTTVFVADLEQRGLVSRSVDPADRRGRIVTVTEAGLRIADRAEAILDTPPASFAALSADDLAELERILARLDP